jgi:hypothetical protein
MLRARMPERTRRITRIGSVAAYVVATSGSLGVLTLGLYSSDAHPWGTVNDLFRLVMTAAIPPLMLTYYELGGWFPLRLAQLGQALGWLSALAWCVVQLLMLIGLVTFDYDHAASGAFAVQTWALVYLGLWIIGGNVVAGSWLSWIRWVGLLAGIGTIVLGVGLLTQGIGGAWTFAGSIGYLAILPVWALLMGRHLRRVRAAGNPDAALGAGETPVLEEQHRPA